MRCSRSWWCARPFAAAVGLWASAWALALPLGAAEPGPARRLPGTEHFLNHEFSLAAAAHERALAREPENPDAHVRFGAALLYVELDRLRRLDTSAFRDDEEYYADGKPEPDPQVGARILEVLRGGEALCERRLKTSPADRQALHALAQILALRANYQFMVSKAYLRALSNGKRAKSLSDRLAQLHPDFVDGQLVAGVQQYIVGSLPWPVRAVIALSGYRGNKHRGLRLIARVAEDGGEKRDHARVLLALLLSRERRHREAAEAFRALMADFPRNYTFQLEAAAMYRAAGEPRTALGLLRDAVRKYEGGEARFERMPDGMAAALRRLIARLEAAGDAPE